MKEEWKKVKLGELYEVHNGLSKGGKFFGFGYPFLSFSTIFNNWFIPETIKDLVQSTEVERANFSVKAGDVFITRTSETADELGMSCVALKDYPNATYNGFCKRLRPIESDYSLNYKYIGYYLRTKSFRNNFLGLSGAMTTRASLKNDDLLAMEITLPPLPTQQKIASVLSAYDDLIENNRRQIKLLEEAALKLYKEWFVKLNFPGHETTKIADGVPDGWKEGILSDIAIDVGKTVNKKDRNQYKYYLPIDCLPKKSLSYTSYNSVDLAESSLSSFNSGDVVFGAMRPYFHKVVIARDLGLTRNTCFVINSENPEYYAYMVMLLFSEDTIKYATKISVGTTMPYVRWTDLQKMPIIIPSKQISQNFGQLVIPYFEKSKKLALQIEQLQSARDKLLPKLMNGEIEV